MKPTEKEVRERFEKEVAKHVMTVKHEAGLYRHIRFAEPGTGAYAFSILTWPGSLCIDGDMGTYTFERIEDMFEFFRRPEGDLSINPQYWAEKVTAADKVSGIQEYDPDVFRRKIADWLDELHASADVRDAVEAEVLPRAEDGEGPARAAVESFQHDDEEGGVFEFCDFWETNLKVYGQHFLWCLYAIVWGVRQWDARAAEPAALLPTILVEPPGTVAVAPDGDWQFGPAPEGEWLICWVRGPKTYLGDDADGGTEFWTPGLFAKVDPGPIFPDTSRAEIDAMLNRKPAWLFTYKQRPDPTLTVLAWKKAPGRPEALTTAAE